MRPTDEELLKRTFVPYGDDDFGMPPDEAYWEGSGPTDKDAPVISDDD